ncbi:3-dehydroquinate synthase [Gloeocapsa sp. PCC 73106]|uniref:3-dehydroquinate synthase n=1 Tax=Gloeocapsa sp. PCC 73106 TaxID=102232 RepID=UPI0002ABAEDC|nr:3-dehydroquinate synthase [Gloeocapsa sp. PCC 73106]ELR99415.1 3-dehydroquinate synthase [Gloeocapsa sp. PCC 73106]
MQTISVNLPQNSYQIAIAPGILSEVGNYLSELKLGQKILVISNPEIFDFWGDLVVNALENSGFTVFTHLIPAGESHKQLESISHIYDLALEKHLERNSTFLALGGGVIGDMTGFAAATWLRGVNFVQVPTTLLAMVDASIGGKTGVNHPQGKNLIGAFYQPRLVLIDTIVLKTLPSREWRAGMAEVIKYGVIWDCELFSQLEASAQLSQMSALTPELLETIISRSCQAKVDVVSQDEKEAGLRAILNYGHTIGHALESLTGYNSLNHGEAVAIGMVMAGEIAVKLQLWSSGESQRQHSLILKAGLPTQMRENLAPEDILTCLQSDKKVKDGRIRFVLPKAIGEAIISDQVSSALIREILG